MPHVPGRLRAVVISSLVTILVIGASPLAALAHDPPGQGRFMNALGEVESGGRYDARNSESGAYGKYQIMPSNWRAWARLYLGNADALPTPHNQEVVARAKIRALYHWLDSWRVVAHWWLTGSSSRDAATWSDSSTRYVEKVMTIYRQSEPTKPSKPTKPKKPAKPARPARRAIGDTNRSIVYEGGWRTARHDSYSGDTVHYADRSGATARLTFTGRSVTWIGPKGPTRGQARVFVDGRLVRRVDLRTAGFQPRAALFGFAWPKAGRHTIRIEVLGTRGRPMVAIDEFVVRS